MIDIFSGAGSVGAWRVIELAKLGTKLLSANDPLELRPCDGRSCSSAAELGLEFLEPKEPKSTRTLMAWSR